MKRIGILTSGGDCAGLNAAMRGVVFASYRLMECEIYGIKHGFEGLINGDISKMDLEDFSSILYKGGTVLRSHRTPFKKMRKIETDGIDKVQAMVRNYKRYNLDCIVCLGGNGTHKNANLLREEGLNVIALPKTIDNDIWDTEITFGYQTAIEVATDVVKRVRTTAASHDRVIIVELMGHKTGWLAINTGIAGEADMILIPEIPYNEEAILEVIKRNHENAKNYTVIVVAEGAKSIKESFMKKKEFKRYIERNENKNTSERIASIIKRKISDEIRVVNPSYILRGGSPIAFDIVLASKIGVFTGKLIKEEKYGVAVSIYNGNCIKNPLENVAGKLKIVEEENELVVTAKLLGINFGEMNFNELKK